jgi:hypothetical protein
MAHNNEMCKDCPQNGIRANYGVDFDEYYTLDNQVIVSWGKCPCPKNEDK